MNGLLKTILTGAALASLAGTAFAQATRPQAADAPPRATAQRGAEAAGNFTMKGAAEAVVAEAPFARLAALIRRDRIVERNKNVQNVRREGTGVYCIRPTAASAINPATAVVTLTPEYFFSLYNEVKVQWASEGSDCNANEIAVYTLADVNLNGVYVFSNAVSFSIIVP